LNPAEALRVLREHFDLSRELLSLVERENRAIQSPAAFDPQEFAQARKSLLPRLNEAYKNLKEVGFTWNRLNREERQRHADVASLIRQNQDLIMKIVLLDRENEQALLRHGLVPTAKLPSVNRQRPHFVADLYRRSSNP
jgi:hypothetical protein